VCKFFLWLYVSFVSIFTGSILNVSIVTGSILSMSIFIPVQTFAQSVEPEQIRLDTSKPLKLEYYSPSFNKKDGIEDSAFLLVRDSATKKSAKVEMRETGPNTGQFAGQFIIRFGSDDSAAAPEVYLVPAKMSEDLKSLERLIADGVLLNKPYFFRPDKQQQVVTLFETKEQALKAMDLHVNAAAYVEAASKAAVEAQQKAEEARKLGQEAQRIAEAAAEKARLEKLAMDQAAERARIEEAEKRKKEELIRQAALMTAAEQAKRKQEAASLAKQALAHYNKQQYAEAEQKFEKSIELDPENQKFSYQLGVSQYRMEHYNRAVVSLETASGPDVNAFERDYFLGLAYVKLKEPKQARPKFAAAKASEDKTVSASAAFYMGVIDYQAEAFDSAKAEFEFVLDASNDPKLDEQADLYLDQIANALQFQKQLERRWSGTLNFGLMYDSNILNQADANSSTGLYGYRGVYGGSLDYRAVFTPVHEFTPSLAFSDLYTVTSSFKPESSYQNTDPLQFSLALPWKYKGMFFGKPGQGGLRATYETLRLNADTAGSRETISHSYVLKSDVVLVKSDSVFASYFLEIRKDVSTIEVAADNLRQSAMKASFGTTRTYFQDKKKTEAWILDGTLSNNAALGEELRYQKLDAGVMYLFPWIWSGSWTTKLNLAYAKYPSHSATRADTTGGLTVGMTKPLTKSLTGIFNLGYTKNNSSVTTSSYNKFTFLTMVSWNGVL